MSVNLTFGIIIIASILTTILLNLKKIKNKEKLNSRLFDKEKNQQTSSINPHIKSILDDYVD